MQAACECFCASLTCSRVRDVTPWIRTQDHFVTWKGPETNPLFYPGCLSRQPQRAPTAMAEERTHHFSAMAQASVSTHMWWRSSYATHRQQRSSPAGMHIHGHYMIWVFRSKVEKCKQFSPATGFRTSKTSQVQKQRLVGKPGWFEIEQLGRPGLSSKPGLIGKLGFGHISLSIEIWYHEWSPYTIYSIRYNI